MYNGVGRKEKKGIVKSGLYDFVVQTYKLVAYKGYQLFEQPC